MALTDAGWSALGSIITGVTSAATGIAGTVVQGKTDVANIQSNTELTKDTSNTTRTIIIVAGVIVTVLVGIILFGMFVRKK